HKRRSCGCDTSFTIARSSRSSENCNGNRPFPALFLGAGAGQATVALVNRAREIPVCGWKAVAAVFARRPECVRRLFFDPETGRRAGEFSRYLAKSRRIYRQVEPEELAKVAGTVHH